jgi:hypothetical protein
MASALQDVLHALPSPQLQGLAQFCMQLRNGMQVSAGHMHTLLRSCFGQVFGCGSSEFGQLGPSTEACVTVPRSISLPGASASMASALLVLACGDHSMAMCCNCREVAVTPAPFQTCNTQLTIPDLLALAKVTHSDAEQLPARAARVRELIEAIHKVFSSPGLLIAGFSLPLEHARAGMEDPNRLDPGSAVPHGLDIDAITTLFEAVLLVLESDVVLGLRKAITSLLQRIELREEAHQRNGTATALLQAQWLKVCSTDIDSLLCSDALQCLDL